MTYMEENLNMMVKELAHIIQGRLQAANSYFGVRTAIHPADFWIYGEILYEIKPDFVIVAGSAGSALALAHVLDSISRGQVIWMAPGDEMVPDQVRTHPGIMAITGDACEKLPEVRQHIGNNSSVLVLAEVTGSREKTLKLLNTCGPLVTTGSYLIVQGIPCCQAPGDDEPSGDQQAISAFIAENRHFTIDRTKEAFFITSCPGGFLKRLDGPVENRRKPPAGPSRPSLKAAEIIGCSVEDERGQPLKEIDEMKRFEVRITCRFNRNVEKPVYVLGFQDEKGEMIQGINTTITRTITYDCMPGEMVSVAFTVNNCFDKGKLTVAAAVLSSDETKPYDLRENLWSLEVKKPSVMTEKGISIHRLKHMEEDPAMPLRDLNIIILFRQIIDSTYHGIKTLKNPFDFWTYMELIHELRPDVIIEVGNARCGSVLALAHLLDRMNRGRVIGLDLTHDSVPDQVKKHPRISLITGDATENFLKVKQLIHEGEKVMVIEDSSHTYENTLQVLRTYSPLVSVDSYFIVEDGINWHGYDGGHFPGPYEAIETFTGENGHFSIDRSREAFFLTQNPKGYLKRITAPQAPCK